MTFQPTWGRLIAVALVIFAFALALLAWRVEAGADPALGTAGASASSRNPSRDAAGAAPQTPSPQTWSPRDLGQGSASGDGSADDGSASGGAPTMPGPSTHQS